MRSHMPDDEKVRRGAQGEGLHHGHRRREDDRARFDDLVLRARKALNAESPQLTEVIETAEQACRIRPTDTTALTLLAEAHFQEGRQPQETEEVFAAACRHEPALSWHLMAVLADFWVEHGDERSAESALGRAVEIDGEDPRCHITLAEHLLGAGRPDKALEVLYNAPERVREQPEFAGQIEDMATHVRWHRKLQGSPLAALSALLRPTRAAWALLEHLWSCGTCRRQLQNALRTQNDLLAQFTAGAPVLGGSVASVQATNTHATAHVTLQLHRVRDEADSTEWAFEVEGDAPPGRWYLEAWAGTNAGIDVSLAVASLTSGSIVLPARLGGSAVHPRDLSWRLTQAEEEGE